MDRIKLNKIIDLIDSKIGSDGFECVDIEWIGSERILRLYVDFAANDATGKGIDLEGCVAVNRLLAECEELDSEIPGAYTLEVSSPGIERPLRLARHFQQSIGELAQVVLREKIENRKKAKGRILSVNDNELGSTVSLDVDSDVWTFPINNVHKANVIFNWNS